MSSCWSCTVIIEQGAKVCPFCGADQSQPVKFVDPNTPQPRTAKSLLRDWDIVIVAVVVVAGVSAGIFWHNFGEQSISPASQSAGVAAKSLRDIREALSTYALSAKDSYPPSLNSLGDRVSLPMQTAMNAGYRLEYSPTPSSGAGAPRGFVILARPEKNDYPNLFIDESGVVRATLESHPATAKDSPL